MSSVNDGSCFCNGTTVDLPGDFARRIFRECLYTTTDTLSFFIGLSSLAFWIFAQAPQFILNCKLGRAKGLSLCFLLEWLTGDSLNLVGAFLTGQVGTAIATSLLFVSMDITLASQYLLLEKPCCGGHDEDDEEETEIQHEQLDNPLLDSKQNSYGGTQRSSSERSLYAIFLPVVFLSAMTLGSCSVMQLNGMDFGQERSLSQRAAERNLGGGGGVFRGGRSLLSLQPLPQVNCEAAPPPSLLGTILSWASASIYLLSRIPQIVKNYRRRSVEGLSPILFACAVLGNTTYALGIIIKGQRLIGALPFLIGSIGTLCFDATILIQFFIYRGLKPRPRSIITKKKKTLLEGIHGVSHWANSPFASPSERSQRLIDQHAAEQSHGGIRRSALNKSYGRDAIISSP